MKTKQQLQELVYREDEMLINVVEKKLVEDMNIGSRSSHILMSEAQYDRIRDKVVNAGFPNVSYYKGINAFMAVGL